MSEIKNGSVGGQPSQEIEGITEALEMQHLEDYVQGLKDGIDARLIEAKVEMAKAMLKYQENLAKFTAEKLGNSQTYVLGLKDTFEKEKTKIQRKLKGTY